MAGEKNKTLKQSSVKNPTILVNVNQGGKFAGHNQAQNEDCRL